MNFERKYKHDSAYPPPFPPHPSPTLYPLPPARKRKTRNLDYYIRGSCFCSKIAFLLEFAPLPSFVFTSLTVVASGHNRHIWFIFWIFYRKLVRPPRLSFETRRVRLRAGGCDLGLRGDWEGDGLEGVGLALRWSFVLRCRVRSETEVRGSVIRWPWRRRCSWRTPARGFESRWLGRVLCEFYLGFTSLSRENQKC